MYPFGISNFNPSPIKATPINIRKDNAKILKEG